MSLLLAYINEYRKIGLGILIFDFIYFLLFKEMNTKTKSGNSEGQSGRNGRDLWLENLIIQIRSNYFYSICNIWEFINYWYIFKNIIQISSLLKFFYI